MSSWKLEGNSGLTDSEHSSLAEFVLPGDLEAAPTGDSDGSPGLSLGHGVTRDRDGGDARPRRRPGPPGGGCRRGRRRPGAPAGHATGPLACGSGRGADGKIKLLITGRPFARAAKGRRPERPGLGQARGPINLAT
jgi:hypothetical protein